MRHSMGRRLRLAAVVVAVVVIGVIIHEFRLVDRAVFALDEWRREHEWEGRSLWLPAYRLAMEKRLAGVEANLSGLTWNNDTKTLFAVINKPARLVELSTEGLILRSIFLRGFHDTEAVEYIGGGRYVIAEERMQKLTLVTILADTTELQADGTERATLGLGEAGNSGVEGLAWDAARGILYAAKERRPLRIYEISGFPQAPTATGDITVAVDRTRDGRLFMADLSGLDFNTTYGHLLALSDASKLLLEIGRDGRPISALSLVLGHGLSRPVPQAEGIAIDDDDNIYLVSEPNIFYVFKKPSGG